MDPANSFGLLRFCLEHMDDPSALTSSTFKEGRDPKDYDFLLAALGNMESEIHKAIKLLNKLKETQDLFEIKAFLEGLQYYCEDIDVAQGIIKVEGLETILTYISHEDPEVRYISAWAVASILQSNFITQEYAIKINAIEPLVKAMNNETDAKALGKQLYALSTALSNIIMTRSFIDLDGAQILNKQLKIKSTEESQPVKAKLVWVLSKIISNIPITKLLFAESGTIQILFELLKDDQECSLIRRNIISFFAECLKDAPAQIIKYFKGNPLPTIKESLLEEDELTDLNTIKAKLNSK